MKKTLSQKRIYLLFELERVFFFKVLDFIEKLYERRKRKKINFVIGYIISNILSTQMSLIINQKKKLKSVENYENQLLKSGGFWSGENQKN